MENSCVLSSVSWTGTEGAVIDIIVTNKPTVLKIVDTFFTNCGLTDNNNIIPKNIYIENTINDLTYLTSDNWMRTIVAPNNSTEKEMFLLNNK